MAIKNNFFDIVTKDTIWKEYINNDFIIRLLKGNLEMIEYNKYLLQDNYFLQQCCEIMLENILYKNHPMEFKKLLQDSINSAINFELQEGMRNANTYNIKKYKIEKVTLNYLNVIKECNKNYNSLIAFVLAPCPVGYIIGVTQNDIYKSNNLISKKWQQIYTKKNKEVDVCLKMWVKYINKLYTKLSDENKIKAVELFKLSTKCEVDFFNSFLL